MGFRESLEHICRSVDGALAASIMGFDGIAVETHEAAPPDPGGVNVGSAMVEYSNIFGQIRSAAEHLQAGDASEVTIRTEKLAAVARVISPDYFVAVALAPDGNLGKARYALRVGAGRIAAEL